MCIRLLLFSTLLIITGCTHQHSLRVFETDRLVELNAQVVGKRVTVTMRNGTRHVAKAFQVAPDSTSWLSESNEVISVSTHEVADMRVRDHRRGALNGIIVGVLIGTTAGVFSGLASSQGAFSFGTEAPPAGEAILTEGARLGAIGGLAGLAIGGARGSDLVHLLVPQRVSGPVRIAPQTGGRPDMHLAHTHTTHSPYPAEPTLDSDAVFRTDRSL